MNQAKSDSRPALPVTRSVRRWQLVLLIIAAASAGAAGMYQFGIRQSGSESSSAPESRAENGGETTNGHLVMTDVGNSVPVVDFPESQWETAGIELQPVVRGAFESTIPLTGKVTLNQERIAHIYSMVEGAVHDVSVSLGDTVTADQLLAVIHSREIGESKLKLYQANLQLEVARSKHAIQLEITSNTEELMKVLRDKTPIEKIESIFRNRPMGDFRERVLNAYSNYLKSAADVARLEGVVGSGAVSGSQLLTAEANRNADLATFQARMEQIEYELGLSKLLSSQAVKAAETEVAVGSTSLKILGCEPDELLNIDPMSQGEQISHYNIRAPFDGTVLTKDVVLREQVRPDVMLLSIADLSTVWVTADIYEEHVPLLRGLTNSSITFHNEAWSDQTFTAEIFYTGEIMDETTRTIAMRAIARNDQHLLKPGMFVTVELPGKSEVDELQVPLGAVQEHEGAKFVFIHKGGEKFERRDLKLGMANDNSVLVEDGLVVGDSVVTHGGFILKSLMLAELMGEE